MTAVAKNILQVSLSGTICCISIAPAQAQVIPDTTLPHNSVVTSEHNNITVTGGTSEGANLFHSFMKFSVRTGESVYFDNPHTVENIIMRVTGSDVSNIDGLIRTAGNVNFYLINPHGINFGKNAALDIKGSLFFSTTDSWKFPDDNSLDVNSTPLLRISAPIGLQWGKVSSNNIEPGNIQIDANLSFKDLNLAANNVTIIGNLTSKGNVNIAAKSINLDSGVIKSVQAGNVTLQANVISLSNGSKLINNAINEKGGDINIEANNQLIITGEETGIFTDTALNSTVDGGNIYLKAPTVRINDRARVSVSSRGSGNSGDLELVSDSLTIEGGTLSTRTVTVGGNVNVYANNLLTLQDNATISTLSYGKGNGANINVQAGFVLVNANDNNDITTNVMQGSGGKIKISSNAIFGLQISPYLTERSDISVTKPRDNNININTINVDINRGVTQLPTSLIDVSNQINQTCSNQATINEFIIIGRGGLPPNTTEALNLNSGWIDWRHVSSGKREDKVLTQHQLVEATGWQVNNGRVQLVADTSPTPECKPALNLSSNVSKRVHTYLDPPNLPKFEGL